MGAAADSLRLAELGSLTKQPVEDFSAEGQDAKIVLEGIGAAYRVPVVVDADVQGSLSFELHHADVATLLDAVCQPKGWFWEVSPRGFLRVRRFVTRIYPVDYLQMTQSGSSSATVNLSETAGTPAAGGSASPSQAQLQGASGQSALASTNSGGTSTLSVSQQNDADFWTRLETDLKGMVGEGEGLVVNRFAGLVQLTGSMRTHAVMEAYLRRVLQRVGRQARISVKVVEVDLNDQSKAGIDWSLVSASLGSVGHTAFGISGIATGTGGISQVGSVSLNPATFTGTISAGGVQAALTALAEQGNVRVESKPEVAALNNQTAFVQVSEDEPFFSRTNTTTINAGGTTTAGTQPIVSTNYSESTVSFGNVLEITVQIADDLSTKLALSPAMTELKGTVTSPDGQETAPITGTKRARTTVTVHNHETAVLGGFITETRGSDRRGIPAVSNLPLVGNAFSTKASVVTRTELVFLVTVNAEDAPRLVPIETDDAPAATGGLPEPEKPRGAKDGVEAIDGLKDLS
jgi:type II secretory pathway component GspD/PulD (secretin)